MKYLANKQVSLSSQKGNFSHFATIFFCAKLQTDILIYVNCCYLKLPLICRLKIFSLPEIFKIMPLVGSSVYNRSRSMLLLVAFSSSHDQIKNLLKPKLSPKNGTEKRQKKVFPDRRRPNFVEKKSWQNVKSCLFESFMTLVCSQDFSSKF